MEPGLFTIEPGFAVPLELVSDATTLVLKSETVTLNGHVTIDGSYIQGPGTLATTGTVTVINGAALTDDAVWTNQGTVDVTSGQIGGGPFNNQTSAVLNITGDGNPFLSDVTLTNAGTVDSGSSGLTYMEASVTNTGSVVVLAGTLDLTADFVNDGTAVIDSGSRLDVASAVDPSSSGLFLLEGSCSLEIAAALGSGTKIQFLGSSPSNELIIDNFANFGTHVGSSSYAGPLLESFGPGDTIDLKDLSSTGLALSFSAATGDLQLTNSSSHATLKFQTSSLGSGTFYAASDGAGGTLLTHH
jgi:hypothetical protein